MIVNLMRLIWNGHVLYHADHPNYGNFSEWGVGLPARDIVMEPVGGTDWQIYRRSTLQGKVYGVKMQVYAKTKMALDDLIVAWEGYMAPDVGIKTLTRVTAGGDTLCLDAVALTPVWSHDKADPRVITVSQEWMTQYPYWRAATESSANGVINGGAINITNSGTVPAWARIKITGICNKPRLTNADGKLVEVNVNMTNAADVLAINCAPHATIVYTPFGGAATNYYGYRSDTSQFFRIAAGATTVTPTGAAGAAAVVVYWYPYHRALT